MSLILESALSTIDWDFPNSNKTKDIHSIHSYPAKFIPEIPRTLIQLIQPANDTILFDPFCGSGTTLIEAQAAGIKSIGIDINPIATLIAGVKARGVPNTYLEVVESIISSLNSGLKTNTIKSLCQIPNVDHWFQAESQKFIQLVQIEISKYKGRMRDGLNLALSAIMTKISNQESDTRYASINKSISFNQMLQYYHDAAKLIYRHCNKPARIQCQVFTMDSRLITTKMFDAPIGLSITSPPYPNAYEYWLYHKYRMYWLNHDPIAVKNNELGARPLYHTAKPESPQVFFDSLSKIYRVVYSASAKGSAHAIVIGRSIIHGRQIDNYKLTIEVMKAIGFKLYYIAERSINQSRKSFNLKHGKSKTEHILVFRK